MFFIWVIVAGLLQVTVFTDLNLLVILTAFGGLKRGPLPGLLIGLSIGVFNSIFSVSPFGSSAILYGMIGFLSGFARSRIFYKETILMYIIFSFCALFLFYSAYFILTNNISIFVLPTILFSTLVSPVVFRIVER